jgi:hypothetical protein
MGPIESALDPLDQPFDNRTVSPVLDRLQGIGDGSPAPAEKLNEILLGPFEYDIGEIDRQLSGERRAPKAALAVQHLAQTHIGLLGHRLRQEEDFPVCAQFLEMKTALAVSQVPNPRKHDVTLQDRTTVLSL